MQTAAADNASLSYGGLLGTAHTEAIKTLLRKDLPPHPQTRAQKVLTRIVGWFGAPTGEATPIDLSILMEFSADESTISYSVISPDLVGTPVAYMGVGGKEPLTDFWIGHLPAQEALMFSKYAGFWHESQVVDAKNSLYMTAPTKYWKFGADQLTINYKDRETGESTTVVSVPVVTLEPE